MNRTMILDYAIGALIAYCLFGIYLFFSQSKFIYFPEKQHFSVCDDFAGYEQMTFQGTRFYFLRQGEEAVIFYHGNAGSACDRGYLKPILEPTKKSIIIVEYAGYSSDHRRPSKKLILKDVENIDSWLKNQRFGKIHVMGESLGTGAASYHASLEGVQKLILVSPFNSLAQAAPGFYNIYPLKFIMTENYNNVKYLKEYRGELLIIHGSNDAIIPPKLSRNLYDSLENTKKEYTLIEGASHNDIFHFDALKDKIAGFLSTSQ